MVSDTTAQLYVPIAFSIAAPGQPAPDAPLLMNQTLVKTASGWRIASILPIPVASAGASSAEVSIFGIAPWARRAVL